MQHAGRNTLGQEPVPAALERTCVLYPRRFAARLPTADARFSSLAAPPFAASARPEEVRHQLGAIGLSFDVILALPPAELLDVASSAEWTRVRSAEKVAEEAAEELRARSAGSRAYVARQPSIWSTPTRMNWTACSAGSPRRP